jgi:hypothetical protein
MQGAFGSAEVEGRAAEGQALERVRELVQEVQPRAQRPAQEPVLGAQAPERV